MPPIQTPALPVIARRQSGAARRSAPAESTDPAVGCFDTTHPAA
ncbi:hypothetical protein SAHL_09470 [Salinisphaera orenii YIM 95161]|uniref:Uncharacterized protein n=1 Tax=Salinisphaera orenii YIM 95161 TaxID=1051139 RepID=A0A423PUD8_9GAMM|nr:hypothetical protein SAHL_09470 [Salinisphaera halophila YIM 95161]